MEPTLAPQSTNPKPHHHTSAHLIYGISIIILALVLCGLICVVADVPIPYISELYAPEVVPAPLAPPSFHHAMAASADTSMVTSTSTMTTSSTSVH